MEDGCSMNTADLELYRAASWVPALLKGELSGTPSQSSPSDRSRKKRSQGQEARWKWNICIISVGMCEFHHIYLCLDLVRWFNVTTGTNESVGIHGLP